MKKGIVILLLILFIFPSINSYAIDNEIIATLDGKNIEYDIPPMIIHNNTFIPIRKTAEAMGAKVNWDNSTQTAIIDIDNIKIYFRIGEPNAVIDKTPVKLDTPAILKNDRTMVPLSFLSKGLNINADWNQEAGTIKITTSKLKLAEKYYENKDGDFKIKLPNGSNVVPVTKKDDAVVIGVHAQNYTITITSQKNSDGYNLDKAIKNILDKKVIPNINGGKDVTQTKRENIKVAGQDAVLAELSYNKMVRTLILFTTDSDNIQMVAITSYEPFYSKNLSAFKDILKSFAPLN